MDDDEVVPAEPHRTPKAPYIEASSLHAHPRITCLSTCLSTWSNGLKYKKESEEAHIMTCERRQENLYPKHRSREQ